MAGHPKGTVLIVEDEPLIRMFIRDALEQGGYSTDEAGNAHQALEMLENDSYKAVLTDIGMPGDLSGLDLALAVEMKWPEIGIVVTSGETLPAPNDLPPEARFVAKPVQVDILLQAVREVVGGPNNPKERAVK
jgi:DNA-binding NtrC family response regulator